MSDNAVRICENKIGLASNEQSSEYISREQVVDCCSTHELVKILNKFAALNG